MLKEQESPRVAVGPVLMAALSIHSLLEGLPLSRFSVSKILVPTSQDLDLALI